MFEYIYNYDILMNELKKDNKYSIAICQITQFFNFQKHEELEKLLVVFNDVFDKLKEFSDAEKTLKGQDMFVKNKLLDSDYPRRRERFISINLGEEYISLKSKYFELTEVIEKLKIDIWRHAVDISLIEIMEIQMKSDDIERANKSAFIKTNLSNIISNTERLKTMYEFVRHWKNSIKMKNTEVFLAKLDSSNVRNLANFIKTHYFHHFDDLLNR